MTESLMKVLGNTPKIKVLDFLLVYSSFDYTKTQIARETGISRITMNKVWKELEKESFIVKTRKIGNAQLYKLNLENPQVKLLAELQYNVLKQENGKIPEKIKQKAFVRAR